MIISIIVLLISIVLHEVAHAIVADFRGDQTARDQGRITLNPLVHMDLVGSFLVPGVLFLSGSGLLFGWAKPVPVNMFALKKPWQDMMWVALAGPFVNLCLALLSAYSLTFFLDHELSRTFFVQAYYINMILMIFNLIPCPPLDGSRVLAFFLPEKGRMYLYQLEKWGIVIILILAYLGIFSNLFKEMFPILSRILSEIAR